MLLNYNVDKSVYELMIACMAVLEEAVAVTSRKPLRPKESV